MADVDRLLPKSRQFLMIFKLQYIKSTLNVIETYLLHYKSFILNNCEFVPKNNINNIHIMSNII